jgi:hypothetical protein
MLLDFPFACHEPRLPVGGVRIRVEVELWVISAMRRRSDIDERHDAVVFQQANELVQTVVTVTDCKEFHRLPALLITALPLKNHRAREDFEPQRTPRTPRR